MSTVKRTVIDDYPVEKLPSDLHLDLAAGPRARITIEQTVSDRWAPLLERIEQYHRNNPGRSVTTEEAVARIRALRDEWD